LLTAKSRGADGSVGEGVACRLCGEKEGSCAPFMRVVEFGAAGLVLLFGYLAAERVTCFWGHGGSSYSAYSAFPFSA
jgi:hypothetical protein